MIDLLLRLLDNVKQLVELRNKRASTIFEKLIEPTFSDLQVVHQDYLETLGQLIDLLPSNDDNQADYQQKINNALTFLKARSARLEPVREKLRGYRGLREARHRAVTKMTDVGRFLNSVLDYLYWSVPDVAMYASFYRTWIEELEERTAPGDSEWARSPRMRGGLRNDCINQREEMRMRWSDVAGVYADIKVKTVSR